MNRAPASTTPRLRLLADLRAEAEWQDEAACRGVDADLFFPERGASTREAKEICAGCPVRAACLDYALKAHETFGVWGGTSARERRGKSRVVTPDLLDRAMPGSTEPAGGSVGIEAKKFAYDALRDAAKRQADLGPVWDFYGALAEEAAAQALQLEQAAVGR